MSDDRPRTFGDLRLRPWIRTTDAARVCQFCKRWGSSIPGGLWKYSVRHYICDDCIAERADVVLPAIRKHEKFDAKLAAAVAKVQAAAATTEIVDTAAAAKTLAAAELGIELEELEALQAWKASHGRFWRNELLAAWERSAAGPALQRLRNRMGPAWLLTVRI